MQNVAANVRLINKEISESLKQSLQSLGNEIKGDLFFDISTRLMYATDASAFRELPLGVVRPKDESDIIRIVSFARELGITLIPRAAGTSLAGQVVGRGLVVDVSRYMTRVVEYNTEQQWVKVQPGVILDELNKALRETELFFSPETSTSNRCMVGGMIGNNSSGLHSVIYGTTREHLLSLRTVLSDGSVAEFGELSRAEFDAKCQLESLEGKIYRQAREIFENKEYVKSIVDEFPDPRVVRRNTGYALDELALTKFFSGAESKHEKFNFCRLLAGSEGTLAFITEAVLQLDSLPPRCKALVPVHMDSVMDAIKGNLIALKHKASAVELMDSTILELTKGNISQRKNRFFVQGDPGAILIVEFYDDTEENIRQRAASMEKDFRQAGLGSYFPLVTGPDIPKVWALRKAGLGVMSKMKGDAKPVSVIEDTSVTPELLEDYITEFNELLERNNLSCVYHAHISVGELHLRPVLNLKDADDVKMFHQIAGQTAALVKKYRGSLSGEHGDGRLRGEFIPLMVGDVNYNLMRQVKETWDPDHIFNKAKIIDSPPMNTFLRFETGHQVPEPDTIYDFSGEGGMIRHIEQCNGSGDCRKTELTGGTMCPSYMASREEWTTTRARANILREFIGKPGRKGTFDHEEVYNVLDLCLSCKACKSECPSSVDMAKLKSEFLQHWYDIHGIPLRTRAIAYITSFNRLGSLIPGLYNFFLKNPFFSRQLKRVLMFAPERSMPELYKTTVHRWCRKNLNELNSNLPEDAPEVTYFVDEFTNYNDAQIGITTIKLLNNLGVKVLAYHSVQSGRSFLSKGLLRTAKKHANRNIHLFAGIINKERPLIGTEPSAILSFRDEYPELVDSDLRATAKALAEHTFMIEEYLMKLYDNQVFNQNLFTEDSLEIKLHGHCQQKAVASTSETIRMLSIPKNYRVQEIPSGCCGMAGSFGYEKEHYELSMKVGELVLFPEILKTDEELEVAVPGTSCRHQIKDGTGRKGRHPVEILYDAIK